MASAQSGLRDLDLLARITAQLPRMVQALGELVSHESPTADLALTAACGEYFSGWVRRRLGVDAEKITVEGVTHLRWRFGGPTRVLLLGHLDTVWPAGTLPRWPFEVRSDGTATGPGVFDMKSGLVQMVTALEVLPDLDGVTLLVTADEEVGSTTSAELIRSTVAGARAALVAEAPAAGALKIERKGAGVYRYDVTGRASHAGLEPEQGRNAAVAVAHLILAATRLGDAALGTTVTPTVVAAGSTTNTVPATATLAVDVRAATVAEQRRVDEALRELPAVVEDVTYTLAGGINRPPMERRLATELFSLAVEVAADLGLPAPTAVAVGGASDGNITAGEGVRTLDGLGAAGHGAHAEGEHIVIASMVERTALIAGLVTRLQH